MRALVYVEHGGLEQQERATPVPAEPDDVLIEVIGSGICGTDRGVLLGRFPARPGVVMGHESVGTVVGTGAGVVSVAEGDRVVVDPTLSCGHCDRCRRGATNFCRNKRGTEVGVDRDGTFADHVVLPQRFVHRVSPTLSFTEAVLIEPLACVLNNLGAAAVGVDDTVVVLGGGPIGTLVGIVGARTARKVVLVEPDRFRAGVAAARVPRVVADAEPETVLAATDGERPSVVVDTTGTALATAVDLVDDGGRIVLMGFDGSSRETIAPLYLTNHGIRLIGAGDYRGDLFPTAVALATELPLAGLVTHQYPLERFADAFDALGCDLGAEGPRPARGYAAMKVVLRSRDDTPGDDPAEPPVRPRG